MLYALTSVGQTVTIVIDSAAAAIHVTLTTRFSAVHVAGIENPVLVTVRAHTLVSHNRLVATTAVVVDDSREATQLTGDVNRRSQLVAHFYGTKIG